MCFVPPCPFSECGQADRVKAIMLNEEHIAILFTTKKGLDDKILPMDKPSCSFMYDRNIYVKSEVSALRNFLRVNFGD